MLAYKKEKILLQAPLQKPWALFLSVLLYSFFFLALNSFTVQGYARLINESGKIRGGIQRVLQLDPESQEFRDIANQIDASIYELQKLEKAAPCCMDVLT